MKSKTISYYGNSYKVPLWVNYVATDSDGRIFGYKNRPLILVDNKNSCGDAWVLNQADDTAYFIGVTPKWVETLKKV